jgi:hypothetical protein
MTHSSAPRYDRIISLVMIVILGLAVIFLIEVSPNILRLYLGGDFPVITVSWLLIASLVVVASAGADILARGHPEMQTHAWPTLPLGPLRLELAPGFWILPALTIVVCFGFFRLFHAILPGAAFALGLLVTGGLLAATLIAQHYSVDRNPAVRARAQLTLQAITYLIAFGCFSAVYYARLRTLYSASLIAAASALLTYTLLRWHAARSHRLLAAVVGLTMAEATWALNYWAASFLLGGTLLLALFYTTTGLLQHALAGTLNRRVALEFGALGTALLVAVVYATYFI